MILTVNLNPALDRTTVVPDFNLGRIFRVPNMLSLPGGKGFNFARALRTLDKECTNLVVGPFGGHIGRMVWDMAWTEGLTCDGIWIDQETRTCLSIIDPTTDCVTELYEAGPELHPDDWTRLADKIRHLLAEVAWLVLCGSPARGMPEDGLFDLLEWTHAAGVRTVLDTYGPPMARAIETRPYLVKINQVEASSLVGWPVSSLTEALNAARAIQARGVKAVVITLGKDGAVGVDVTGHSFGWIAPNIPSVSAVGSGDSFLAGIIVGLVKGQSLENAVRLGIATGAANTLQIGAAKFELTQVESMLNIVQPLPV